jgi:hypothetical protein
MKSMLAVTCAAVALVSSGAAEAKGCIKGAIVGGVAGHMAGHGKLGAACRLRDRPSRGEQVGSEQGQCSSAVRSKVNIPDARWQRRFARNQAAFDREMP